MIRFSARKTPTNFHGFSQEKYFYNIVLHFSRVAVKIVYGHKTKLIGHVTCELKVESWANILRIDPYYPNRNTRNWKSDNYEYYEYYEYGEYSDNLIR